MAEDADRIVRLNVILGGLFHSAKLLFASGGATDVNTNLPFLTVCHESFDSQYDRVLLLFINIRLPLPVLCIIFLK